MLDISQILDFGGGTMNVLIIKIVGFIVAIEAAKLGLSWLEQSIDDKRLAADQAAFDERFNRWKDTPEQGPRFRGRADDMYAADEDDAYDWDRVEQFYGTADERRAAARNKTAGNAHEWRVDEDDFEEERQRKRKRGIRRYREETGDKPPKRRKRRRSW